METIGRRAFFGRAAALAPVAGGLAALQAAQRPGARPKNIVWMVADGMSAGVLPMAEQFSLRARDKGTVWQALHAKPGIAHAFMDMASLDSMVTDSSSASSSWGSGSRIFNAWINMLPDGTRLAPIGELAHQAGRAVGLVTTATVTHATPAGFAAVSRKRDDEESIARQYLGVCDVVLGGGSRFFDPETRKDKRDVASDFRRAGFAVARTRADLRAASRRVLGLFASSHMPYTLDHRNDPKLRDETPTLAEMTEAALARLAGSRKGFLLQVEGARVDHAAHNNDAAALLWDQLAFDDAIQVVLRFAEKHPETLVVVTSDHGNSNPGLNGTGAEYRDSDRSFERLLKARNSFVALAPRLGGKAEYSMQADTTQAPATLPTAEQVRQAIIECFGFELTARELDSVRSAAAGSRDVTINRQFDKLAGVLGQAVSNHTGIGWTGTSHTSDYVVLTALGPGANRFNGFVRNTDVFPALCEFMDIKHRNPAMAPEQAQQFKAVAAKRAVVSAHWV